jgi:hypothetical protein
VEEKVKTDRKEDRRKKHKGNVKAEREIKLSQTGSGTFNLKNLRPQRSLYVPHSGNYMYRTAVTMCTAQWSLYVPPV